MRDQILSNMNNPRQLEKLYRENRLRFKSSFNRLYPELEQSTLAAYWHERLNYSDEISWGSRKEFLFIVGASIVAGILAKLPAIFPISEEFFYPRNIGFIVFPFLAAYFAWKNKLPDSKIAFISFAIAVCLVYINFLPNHAKSDTLLLACIHLPLLLWIILGVTFAGDELSNYKKRLDYLRFNGDLAVMSALLVIAGVLMTGITIGLFALIGLQIENFYSEYVVAFGLPTVPIVATYLTQTNPQLVSKVSPVIAKLFSPLVLVMLVIYLGAIIYSGKDPYNDREFLLIFNLLLIGVMAIILFSVAETSRVTKSKAEALILFLLSVVTIIVNGIALSAILFRISEWGITPNRAAVLGSNLLILANLLLVTVRLYNVLLKKDDMADVGKSIAWFLPIYCLWIIIVTFLFPLLFRFE